MIGVTIGIGGLWPEIAARSARRMELMTGLKCLVLDGKDIEEDIPGLSGEPVARVTRGGFDLAPWPVPHPSWLKCHVAKILPAEESFLVFDADLFCLNRWDPAGLFERTGGYFCAVPDRNLQTVYHECCQHNLPFPDWYVNGGLTMFGRRHQECIWDAVWKRQPGYGRWLEQTALNKALQGFEVARLPRAFNKLPDVPGAPVTAATIAGMTAGGVINFHYADCGGDGARILALQKELGYE